MNIHTLTKNCTKYFNIEENNDIQGFVFSHANCTCYDEARDAKVIAYGFNTGAVKILFTNKAPRFLTLNGNIRIVKFSNDGLYLGIIYTIANSVQTYLHVIEISNFLQIADVYLLHLANDISNFNVSNTRVHYVVKFPQNRYFQYSVPFITNQQIPYVGVNTNTTRTDLIFYEDEHMYIFNTNELCYQKFGNMAQNQLLKQTNVTFTSLPFYTCHCSRYIWVFGMFGCKLFNLDLELIGESPNYLYLQHEYSGLSLGTTCIFARKGEDSMHLSKIMYNEETHIFSRIDNFRSVSMYPDELNIPLPSLHADTFDYITNSIHPVVINHFHHLPTPDPQLQIPGIPHVLPVPVITIDDVYFMNEVEFIANEQQQEPSEADESDNYSDDADEEDESENEFVQALHVSLQQYRSKSPLQKVIDHIKSSITGHSIWSNLQQFGVNEWSYVKSCISSKNHVMLENSIKTHERLLRDTYEVIDVLLKERKSFADFFGVSEDIGKFDAFVNFYEDDVFDPETIEKVHVSSREKKLFHESDMILLHEAPMCNLKHKDLLKLLFDEVTSHDEMMSVVTTGVIPTINILYSQVSDCVVELKEHVRKLQIMYEYFQKQDASTTNVSSKKKKIV